MFRRNGNISHAIDCLLPILLVLTLLSCDAYYEYPNIFRAKDTVKEAEVKAKAHEIQQALERYAVDHNGQYPAFLIGGDSLGWDPVNGCKVITTVSDENLPPPNDPLIELGYLADYPGNVFIDPGEGITSVIAWTGASLDEGDGDVRFGFLGETMGNCLNDSRVLFDSYGVPTRHRFTLSQNPDAYLGILEEDSPNPFYTMGGIFQWDSNAEGTRRSDVGGRKIKAFWPGQFFYRAGGDFGITDPSTITSEGHEQVWGWPYERIDKFILGAYGSPRSDGFDILRLTVKDGNTASMLDGAIDGAIIGEFYQDHQNPDRAASHPDFDFRVQYSNPEVFGGGNFGLMPQFPYYQAGSGDWMYGAPDGLPDGVIIVLISGSDLPFVSKYLPPLDRTATGVRIAD